jgi:hypothetical protein
MAKTKPDKKRNYCLSCKGEITGRAANALRCARCLGPVYLAKAEERKQVAKLKRLGLYIPPARRGSTFERQLHKPGPEGISLLGLDYVGQAQSKDGKCYTITVSGKWLKVKKVCDGCGRDDASGVNGKWGPIFSDFDCQGRESKPILFCLDCYDLACDATGKQQQQQEAS